MVGETAAWTAHPIFRVHQLGGALQLMIFFVFIFPAPKRDKLVAVVALGNGNKQ